MSYIKAVEILPKELLDVIQNYVDGEYIYIPRKEDNKKSWGESTKFREEIINRNTNIYEEYKKGICIRTIAQKYYLSEKSTQRIILKMKKNA